MKFKGALEKWASGVLGAMCLVLIMNLVRNSVGAGSAPKPNLPPMHTPEPRRVAAPAPSGAKDDLSRYDPEIKLDLLADLQSRYLPEMGRNPFEFPPKPVPKPIGQQIGPSQPPPPPPPPPVPFKLIGYSEKGKGAKEGIIASTVPDDEEIYVVHEGELFAKNYRVTKITPTMVEIVEETTRRVVQLPIAAAP